MASETVAPFLVQHFVSLEDGMIHTRALEMTLEDVEFFVETTRPYRYVLQNLHTGRMEYTKELASMTVKQIEWIVQSECPIFEVGQLEGEPVTIFCSYARLNGHCVLFVEPEGDRYDRNMMLNWLSTQIPPGVKHCTGESFGECIEFVTNNSNTSSTL
jgi:hypothetical protein